MNNISKVDEGQTQESVINNFYQLSFIEFYFVFEQDIQIWLEIF